MALRTFNFLNTFVLRVHAVLPRNTVRSRYEPVAVPSSATAEEQHEETQRSAPPLSKSVFFQRDLGNICLSETYREAGKRGTEMQN